MPVTDTATSITPHATSLAAYNATIAGTSGLKEWYLTGNQRDGVFLGLFAGKNTGFPVFWVVKEFCHVWNDCYGSRKITPPQGTLAIAKIPEGTNFNINDPFNVDMSTVIGWHIRNNADVSYGGGFLEPPPEPPLA